MLCSTGPREGGARRTDQNLAAGKRPRKDALLSLSFRFHSSSALPLGSGGSGARAAPPARGYVCFLVDGQISGLAPVQRKERTGHANSQSDMKQC